MNKKAQTSIIILWVLIIITLLTVSLGYRVSLALRLSKYQRNRLKAHYLAKAGINWGIVELEKDKSSNSYDGINETWSTGRDAQDKAIFENIELEADTGDFFNLSITDAERKININEAAKELLVALLEKCKVIDASKIANNIRAWRGSQEPDIPEEAKNYDNLGYSCKANRFINLEELMLVKDVTAEIYDSLKDLITVYGGLKANINTVSEQVLGVFADTSVKELEAQGIQDRVPGDLINRIIGLRQNSGPFESWQGLRAKLENEAPLSSSQVNVLNQLEPRLDTKSSCFYILSNGIICNKLMAVINCTYDREKQKIIYWHET
ncbi:MAG: hypothetical protein WAW67_01400 [Candidatus Omnitrophota bacterium]